MLAAGRRATARPRAGRPADGRPGGAATARGNPLTIMAAVDSRARQPGSTRTLSPWRPSIRTSSVGVSPAAGGSMWRVMAISSHRSPPYQPVACWFAPAVRPGATTEPSGRVNGRSARIGSEITSTRSSSRPMAEARIRRLSGNPACPTTEPSAMPARKVSGVRSIPRDARTRGPKTLTSTTRRARSRSTSQASPDSVSGQRSSTKPGLAPVATIGMPVGRRELDDLPRLLGIARPDEREVLGDAHDRRAGRSDRGQDGQDVREVRRGRHDRDIGPGVAGWSPRDRSSNGASVARPRPGPRPARRRVPPTDDDPDELQPRAGQRPAP